MLGAAHRSIAGWLRLVAFIAFGNGWHFASSVAAELDDKAALRFFEEQVRPILVENCHECHAANTHESGLRLDSREALLVGGSTGAAVDLEEPERSLLLAAVRYRGDIQMPPSGQLPSSQIERIEQWLKLGAPWPAEDIVSTTARTDPREFSAADRGLWSLQRVCKCDVPRVGDGGWGRNEIDRFIFAKLVEAGLSPAREASRQTLIRRLTFDLTGLPPTRDEVDQFVSDPAEDAYERLVDRLLASPHYGERWARHWLDLVRYAESDAYNGDAFRKDAWRYRDYVVRAFNDDKPYDRFVLEQLAGDELAPGDPDVVVATGYLRHWIFESNQRQTDLVREELLNDVTEVTSDVFLGLSLRCARCHDHKFDPILREDFYRLQAFFSPMTMRFNLPVPLEDRAEYESRLTRWQALTAGVRREIADIERPARLAGVERDFRLYPQEIKDLWRKPAMQRTPAEQQLAEIVAWQQDYSQRQYQEKLDKDSLSKLDALYARLAEFDEYRPQEPGTALLVADVGPVAPGTVMPGDRSYRDIRPGYLSILDAAPARIEPVGTAPYSTGRRTALARWITSRDNPLASRVIVNRVWQYHFGRGIVATSSDFGRLGDAPTHPELLDWLAATFVDRGWSFKELHRLILTSATYQQTALRPADELAARVDPQNHLLWRMNVRRLAAEEIRDSMLLVSNELDTSIGGPSVAASEPRRTVYMKILRNTPDAFLAAFDAPDGFSSIAVRDVTTTAPQSLLLVNGDWPLKRAEAWAQELWQVHGDDWPNIVQNAYRAAYGREPTLAQRAAAVSFLLQQAVRLSAPVACRSRVGR